MVALLAVSALLLGVAQAAVPQALQARAACNRDNCFRDVFGTVTPGRSAQAVKDCTSYLQKTVTPCAVTTTSTVTTTSIGGTAFVTTTSTSTAPAVSATLTTTTTTTSTTTPTTTATITSIATSTLTSTVTVTTTVTANKKRGLVEVRATTPAACPVTSSAACSAIPTYASNCPGSRFSSVCSCNGNVPTTAKTLAASTTTVKTTTTSLTTTTSTKTATATITPTNTATSTVTLTITSTAPAITTTSTATSTTSITTFVTTTTTTTTTAAPAPTCTADSSFYQGVQEACNDGSICQVNRRCVNTNPQGDLGACAAACNADKTCYDYEVSGGFCTLALLCCPEDQ